MKRILYILLVVLTISCQSNSQKEKQNSDGNLVRNSILIGESRLFYQMKGEGKAVVMIHGGLLNMQMWDEQFNIFSQDYKVIRYDAMGHGKSINKNPTYSHHEDLKMLIDSLKLDKPVIMGLSMGGYVAIDFALKYPDIASALVLVSPGLTGFNFDSKQLMEYQNRLIRAVQGGDTKMVIEYFMRSWTDGPYRAPRQVDSVFRVKVRTMIEGTYANFNNSSVEKRVSPEAINRLKEININTITVVGDMDVPDILEIAELIDRDINNSQKVIIQGAAHMVNMEKPEIFNRIVLEFLEKIK